MAPDLLNASMNGIFLLLGIFLGGQINKNLEYEKWMRQQRTREYSEFLKCLHDSRNKAANYLYLGKGERLDKNIQACIELQRLKRHLAIVGIYMSIDNKALLVKLAENYIRLITSPGGPADNGQKIDALEMEIQDIIEAELSVEHRFFRWRRSHR